MRAEPDPGDAIWRGRLGSVLGGFGRRLQHQNDGRPGAEGTPLSAVRPDPSRELLPSYGLHADTALGGDLLGVHFCAEENCSYFSVLLRKAYVSTVTFLREELENGFAAVID